MDISWDEWAVPTIVGGDEQDVVRGIGYATAQAHATTVLELYGLTRGDAAARWGASFVEDDTFTVELDLLRATDRWVAAQTDATMARVEAFCDGFNAACEDDPARGTDRRDVLPVMPRDVVAHALRTLVRFSCMDLKGLAFAPNAFQRTAGSNAWAIAGHRSRTGNAMVTINPHMSWLLGPSAFHRFFEFHTVSPGRDFHGVTLLGVPWQSMGYSHQVAWGHTVNPIRNVRVFDLGLEGGTYEHGGERLSLEVSEHRIEVRDGDPVVVQRRASVHGPVVTAPDGTDVAVQMSALLHDADATALESWWQLSLAGSVEELLETHDRLPLPMFNLVAADSAGSIAALFCGTPPVRDSWADAERRLPGKDPSLLALGKHPASAMPRAVNPAAGWVQNCNENPWLFTDPPLDPAGFPAVAPAPQQVQDVRCFASRTWLAEHETVSPEQLRELKFRKRAFLADMVLDELCEAAAGDEQLAPAVAVLRAWDRECASDSPGYVLFWLWTALNGPALTDYALFGPTVPGQVPDRLADPAGAVELLRNAVGLLEAFGIPLDASVGQVATVGGLPAHGGSGLVGSLKSLELTPTATGLPATAGDTWVAQVELRPDGPPVVQQVLTYGNTTEPTAPPSRPQWPLWAADQFRP